MGINKNYKENCNYYSYSFFDTYKKIYINEKYIDIWI